MKIEEEITQILKELKDNPENRKGISPEFESMMKEWVLRQRSKIKGLPECAVCKTPSDGLKAVQLDVMGNYELVCLNCYEDIQAQYWDDHNRKEAYEVE